MVNHRKYVETILQRFNMQNSKPVKVPIPVGVRLSAEHVHMHHIQIPSDVKERVSYQSILLVESYPPTLMKVTC